MSLRGVILLSKSLVRLRGCDTLSLLNGLLTNEVKTPQQLIYSYLLNSQGRVLFDLFLYKLGDDDVLLEVDKSCEQSLIKALKIYKLRRSVEIVPSPFNACVSGEAQSSVIVQDVDPRLPELGFKSVVEKVPTSDGAPEEDYRRLRYRLGVPEGSTELGVGKAIPLECNGDYLKAISFEKGCYIGQELTARAYHTGVVRKRYMPLRLSDQLGGFEPGSDLPVVNGSSTKVGVLKAVSGQRGLGLMRIKESLEAETLSTGKDTAGNPVALTVSIPKWWPKHR